MFIALEGLQGVGKSTVYHELQSRLDNTWKIVPSISKEINDTRKIVDLSGNADARYLFYLSQVILSGKVIESLLNQNNNVLIESYIFRTITYHEGVGSSLTFSPTQFDIPKPNKVFYLACEDLERIKRINSRNKRVGFWNELAETHNTQIKAKYAELMDKMIVIDTTFISPQDTVEKILSLI